MTRTNPSWVCCQLGAREHYAIPRALQMQGVLNEFITDLWLRPVRFHPALAGAHVKARNVKALGFQLKATATGANGWNLITQCNDWFQRHAVAQLSQHRNGHNTVFAYSYAAERIFKFARERGWKTVLGQIDPGPAEERIVARLHAQTSSKWQPAPKEYWDNWRSECTLADKIVVNSIWSKEALLSEGIPEQKIKVVPLAYDGPSESFKREYPTAFTSERPLRVLFLGQINLRKGVAQLLEAVSLLAGENIEFWFVGPTQVAIPKHRRIRLFGVAPRADVARYYKDADVFILPTLSDGFGLTQLEAQSWKLPVIASRHCGEVVTDGENGIVLQEVSGHSIAETLLKLKPKTLRAMSAKSGVSERFSLRALGESLIRL